MHSNSAFVTAPNEVITMPAPASRCSATRKTSQHDETLRSSNKGLADFSNDVVVSGGGIRVIDQRHDFRVLFFEQLGEQLLLGLFCRIVVMQQISGHSRVQFFHPAPAQPFES